MPRRQRHVHLAIAIVVLSAPLVSCSGSHEHGDVAPSSAEAPSTDGVDATAPRVIDVTMTEFAFEPATIEVGRGEKVTLRFHNEGVVVHEAVVATADEQAAHAEAMAESDGGHMHGMDGIAALVVLEPGLSDGATFVAEDGLLIVCHQPGHEAAGMVAELVIR